MKGLLKNIKGGLKLTTLALPFVVLAGGIAGFAGLIGASFTKRDDLYNQVRNTEVVQELIEQEKAKIGDSFADSDLSLEEYTKRESYLKSTEFIQDMIRNNEQLKDYAAKENNYNNYILYSLIFTVPMIAGTIPIIGLYTHAFDETFCEEKKYKKIIESAKKDFEEAKNLRRQAKQDKELKRYDEEIIKD